MRSTNIGKLIGSGDSTLHSEQLQALAGEKFIVELWQYIVQGLYNYLGDDTKITVEEVKKLKIVFQIKTA